MWELNHKVGWVLKNWCFWILVLEKTHESSLDCKEIKPINPKEINPEHLLERLMLNIKLQDFGHLNQRVISLEKTLMLGKTEGKRRRGWQRMNWLDNMKDSMDVNLSKLWEMVKDREACCIALHGVTHVSNWNIATTNPYLELTWVMKKLYLFNYWMKLNLPFLSDRNDIYFI